MQLMKGIHLMGRKNAMMHHPSMNGHHKVSSMGLELNQGLAKQRRLVLSTAFLHCFEMSVEESQDGEELLCGMVDYALWMVV